MRVHSEASLYGTLIGASLDPQTSLNNFVSTLNEFVVYLGFDFFSFAASQNYTGGPQNEILVDNYARGWKSHYDDNNCTTLDPLFQKSVQTLLPFFWGHDEFLDEQDQNAVDLFRAACDHGIHHGITFPVHTNQNMTCLLTVSGKQNFHLDFDMIGSRFQQLSTASSYVSSFLLSQNLAHEQVAEVQLSRRQMECLQWTMAGKTSWEISKIINRSTATVEFHIQKAIKALGASNKVHAAMIATKSGLI